MAARWGTRARKRSIGTMELFTGGSPLQYHTLEEDGGMSDLGLPPLDTCDLLGTFRGYIDPTIISIIEGAGSQTETKGRYDEENELSLLTALTEILDNADDENLSPFDSIPDSELLVSQRDRDLHRFLSLSRSPTEPNHHLPVDDFKVFKTHGNSATCGKVENRTEDSWDMFPDCLSSTPVKRHKAKNVRKGNRRVRQVSTLQLSDGEKGYNPEHDSSSESSVDFVDFGMNFIEELSTGSTLKPEASASKHGTPHIINTANVSLADLVKYMHSYCLPNQTTVIDSSNSEMDEDLSNGEVLEINDRLSVPVFLVGSSPEFPNIIAVENICPEKVDSNINCTPILAKEVLTENEAAEQKVSAMQSKESTPIELGSKECMLPEEPITSIHSGSLETLDLPPLQKADSDKSVEKPALCNADGTSLQYRNSESLVKIGREEAPAPPPEMDDGMPFLEPEPKMGVGDCEPGMEKQIPALHPQPTSVVDWLGILDEACKPQDKCEEIDKIPVLKQACLGDDDELKKKMQPAGPEVSNLENAMQAETEISGEMTERKVLEMVDGLPLRACSSNQTSGSRVSDFVLVENETEPELLSTMPESVEKTTETVLMNAAVDSTMISKRKYRGRKNVAKVITNEQKKNEVQNVKNKQVDVLPKSPSLPQVPEIADGENTQHKVSLSCLNHPSLQESDLLIKQLEQAKRESEMELKLLKASRAVKSRARNNVESSSAISISETKNSPVKENEAEQCKLEKDASLLTVTTDLLELPEKSLTSCKQFSEEEPTTSELNGASNTPPIDVTISKGQVKCDSADTQTVSPQGDPIEVKSENSASTGEESDPGQSKDVKPKLLSLKEYRMRMQQRKTNAEDNKKDNENLMSNKWPSIPEPPTELAEIPCLMNAKVPEETKGASAKNKAGQQPFMRDSPESPDQEPFGNDITEEMPFSHNPDSARPSVSFENTCIETTPQPVCTVYAEPPIPPWPPVSSLSARYPFLPPIPPPSLSSNAFHPLPFPPSPLLSWPPPFPPPPIGTAPFPFPPGWAPCIPPPPLPPPPYWPSISLPPTVPPPMYFDGCPPLHCPPGFPYPPNIPSALVQGAEYSLNNTANLSPPSAHSTEQKAPSVSYQKSPDAFKKICHSVLNKDTYNANVHGQKSADSGISVVQPVVPNYVKTVSFAPVQACQNRTEAGANKVGSQACNAEKPIQQTTETKMQTMCAPKPENSSKVTLQTLSNQAGTKGIVLKQMDPRSTNELILKIFELLRMAPKPPVQDKVSDPLNPPIKETVPSVPLVPLSGQTVLPSILQHSSAVQGPVVSMTLKPFDTAGPLVHQKPESVVERHFSHEAAASLLITPATKETVIPVSEKPHIALPLTGQKFHPVSPSHKLQVAVPTTVQKFQAAGPTMVQKPQAAVLSMALKSQIKVIEPKTTLRSDGPSVRLEPQPLFPSAALKSQDVIASMVVQSTMLKPRAVVLTETQNPQIPEDNFPGVQEKKLKKCKVNIRKRGIIGKEKAIEACDLTSLLEQFEKSEAKEEKHCSQSPGDSLAVANSRLEAEVENKPPDTLLVTGLGSTAELTPPATPPHQPHSSLTLLGKSSILNTALREGVNHSPVKKVKLIEAQPLPQNRPRRQNSLPRNDMPETPAVHVGFGDHDYCFLQFSQSENLPDATELKTEKALSEPGALVAEGSRWNVKHQQSIVIKPIVSLSKRPQRKDCKVPLAVPGNGTHAPCSLVESMSQKNIADKDWRDQLDHRTSVPNGDNFDCSSTSVLMTPEASPCNSDGGESRTRDGRGNATISKRSLRCYRKHKDTASLQTDWKSRRTRASHSSCSSSESEDSCSSYSSSSSSRSRSRSTPPKKRRRYRSRTSHHSRSSSQSSYGSCARSRGRSSSVSTSYSSRSYSTSYSRSRSRSRSWSRSPYSRRCDYYGNRANYRRRRVPQQECAIEERRVVYIGKIPGVMTKTELKHRFSVFGIIEECNIHFRDHGDNYGFVTYRYTEDAFTAIENGHKLRRPDELPFDLCFGGRRQFCKSNYADLDSNRGDYDPVKNKFDSLDFDTLLKQAQKSIRR